MVDRSNYPLWVRLGLWGLPSRGSAWAFVVISIVAAVAGCVYGLYDARYFACAAFLLAGFLYWAAIRWVDRHGRWK
jgi:hypothetical protein